MAVGSPAEVGGTIAVVDDDPLLRRTVASNLEDAGFRVAAFENGRAALDYISGGGVADAVLLDWQMPGMDGPELLRRLRAGGHAVPVIFLTGHNQPIFEEAALAGGAVDFVDKARSFSILLQRLRLAIAGAKTLSTGGGTPQAGDVKGLTLDNESCRAFWLGTRVDLTISEFKVVRLLAAKAGRDVSYREIYDAVRGDGFQAGTGEDGFRANVRALVKRIRQKFRDIDPQFEGIANYPGFGYRWFDGGPG